MVEDEGGIKEARKKEWFYYSCGGCESYHFIIRGQDCCKRDGWESLVWRMPSEFEFEEMQGDVEFE